MDKTIPSPSTIDSLSAFLKYGPTGLAGLMLLLVIIAYFSPNLSPARERILMRFMLIGAFCFTLSLAANFFAVAGAYPLYLRVVPIDLGSKRALPAPIIKANGNLLDDRMEYLVKSPVTAIVDVSDAIDFVKEFRAQNDQQRQVLNSLVSSTDGIVGDMQKIIAINGQICSGGSNGVPGQASPTVIALAAKTSNILTGLKSAGAAAITLPTPEVKSGKN